MQNVVNGLTQGVFDAGLSWNALDEPGCFRFQESQFPENAHADGGAVVLVEETSPTNTTRTARDVDPKAASIRAAIYVEYIV